MSHATCESLNNFSHTKKIQGHVQKNSQRFAQICLPALLPVVFCSSWWCRRSSLITFPPLFSFKLSVYMFIYIHVCISVCVCMYVGMHIGVYCTCVCVLPTCPTSSRILRLLVWGKSFILELFFCFGSNRDICVYICKCIYICVLMYICMYIHIMYVLCVCVYVCVCVCVCVCVTCSASIRIPRLLVMSEVLFNHIFPTFFFPVICIHVYIYTCVYVCVCMYVCRYTYRSMLYVRVRVLPTCPAFSRILRLLVMLEVLYFGVFSVLEVIGICVYT